MINKSIILSAFLSFALALDDPKIAKIINYQSEHSNQHYFFRFESSDGTIREEEGNVLDPTSDSPIIVKGSYSYPDETGKLITVRYIADENGFHPEGAHIPAPSFSLNPNPQPIAPIQFIQPTPRPQISTTPTRLQIPIDGSVNVTPKPLNFNDLDNRLQNSIINLLANNREARGFTKSNPK